MITIQIILKILMIIVPILKANKAAIKAMLVNRISDFALVLGILTIG
jgi:NADH:ubiquinone oxidoreductase subunit 5 (subunit L)/multisubunit Na+/H+ antiporter MnhA subunit